ncbi:hypothetical protein LG634_21860 [Streptomyces bambusae]|uniref:hypothetical protein n=1 Tax=Streptomyces bambusae TaxID=1550616 RepID=UPI001CFE4F1A|nr:hypothetical protein [Streptomyces bambusae]MCB5167462.1 hypothetical protein [Streptomyces bambusae]
MELAVLLAVLTTTALTLRALTPVPVWAAVAIGACAAAAATRLHPGARILRALPHRD